MWRTLSSPPVISTTVRHCSDPTSWKVNVTRFGGGPYVSGILVRSSSHLPRNGDCRVAAEAGESNSVARQADAKRMPNEYDLIADAPKLQLE